MTLLLLGLNGMAKTKFKIQDYKMVLVSWQDAMDIETGWHSLRKIQSSKTEPVKSLGWLVKDTDKHIVLASDFCSDGTSGRAITIPKDWCSKITKVTTDDS